MATRDVFGERAQTVGFDRPLRADWLFRLACVVGLVGTIVAVTASGSAWELITFPAVVFWMGVIVGSARNVRRGWAAPVSNGPAATPTRPR